jgi:hypothetical protein
MTTSPEAEQREGARKCQCRLCAYDDEFAEHIWFVPAEHRAFFEELKERWEAADFDASWHRACIGGEEFTVELCERYDTELAKVTRRHPESAS